MGEPQKGQAQKKQDRGRCVEPGKAVRPETEPGPGQAPDPAPEQPGPEDETERQLVAVERCGEFPQEIDLEGRRQEAEEEGGKAGPQAQIPATGVPQSLHFPPLSWMSSTRKPVLRMTGRRQPGQ